jgi:cellulose synthase operon protein YhjU
MNHDGHFDNFSDLIKQNGLDAKIMSQKDLSIPLRAFDKSPVYDDNEVLSRWLSNRERDSKNNDSAPVAALYNTVTMHDGNRYTNKKQASMNSRANFKPRLEGLLGDIKEFFNQLEKSKRRVLVIMLPEHGAAMEGDKKQIAGLREIPSPNITLGTAGIRLFGENIKPPLTTIQINEPSSYLELNQIISQLLQNNPFISDNYQTDHLLQDIQQTAIVSENAGTVVLRHIKKYYIRLSGSNKWLEY